MEQEPFGEYVKGIRKGKKLSIRAAAKLIGVGSMRLTEIERGESYRGARTGPSHELVEAMARAYGIPRDTLLHAAGYRPSRPSELTRDEAELLDLYRELPVSAQGHLIDVARSARSHFAIPTSGK